MKTNKNAFTLIELLAVIVILAIIALIATPIILGIINDAKEQSTMRSAELYIDAVEQAIVRKNLEGEYNPEECIIEKGEVACKGKFNPSFCEVKDGQLNCEGVLLEVEIDGEVPEDGTIVFQKGKVINGTELNFKDSKVTLENDKIVISKEDPIPEPVSFAEDSWDTIAKNVKAGNLSKYQVGDIKEIELTINGTLKKHQLRIANTSTPNDCKTDNFSQTACGFVIEFVDIITLHNMNPATTENTYGTNKGGWRDSKLREYITPIDKKTDSGTIYNALPPDLQKVIIDTYTVSGYGPQDSTNFETTDKLYLLSPQEVFASNPSGHDKAADVTRQLDYYYNKGVTTNSASLTIKKYNNSADFWWLRSAYYDNNESFYCVHRSSSWCNGVASSGRGVAPAFRIG